MNLDEIFYSDTEKHLNFLEKALREGSLEEEVSLKLHTLKGDLNYLADASIMQDLAQLKSVFKDSNNSAIKKRQAMALLKLMREKILMNKKLKARAKVDLGAYLHGVAQSVAASLGKKARLIFNLELSNLETQSGLETLAFLKSALTPLVVNSCVHGIESPEQRVAKGKEEAGLIKASVKKEKGQLLIKFSDDGQGVSSEEKTGDALRELYAGEGMGLRLVQELFLERSGTMNVKACKELGFQIKLSVEGEKAKL